VFENGLGGDIPGAEIFINEKGKEKGKKEEEKRKKRKKRGEGL